MAKTSLHIARRYLISKKGSTAVTFITWLAAFAMMTAAAAMFIILSVFSGLEDMNRDLIANLHADLTISSASGKRLKNINTTENLIRSHREIAAYSKIIEEKVVVSYGEVSEIAYLRAVDSAYTTVNPINREVFFGKYPDFTYTNEVLIENSLDNRLRLPVGETEDYAYIYMAKPGVGIITREEDIFNKKEIYASGVFAGKDQLNSYLIAPIDLAQELLDLPPEAAYQIVIKLKDPKRADAVKQNLAAKLGKNFIIKTKEEENSAFWKMINTEKMIIYLIFSLVIFITTFNLAGAIIILQLDKSEQERALSAIGFSAKDLRQIYFYTGLLIVFAGLAAGLVLGTLICWLQIETGFFKATAELPFPVRIRPVNYFTVAAVSAFFGLLVSRIFSKPKVRNTVY
ncbi:ABC transporter permease [Cruoricaptor ignavus]|uniref:ABC transporter permease n=1 Tax=Cruoricaptor ignavus TaxID=1118202 RepID=A0A7M1T3V8_9FLAO|nr:ABC transporter permease [Cruoricaptor ignavus]QOR73592.1 ABC transporter permease [Cruoricaptor ignavus]